jgi:hypothetical protein
MLVRDSDGKLPGFAWPGGYPIVYVCADGGVLCHSEECANGPEAKEADPYDPQWMIESQNIHWEGPPLCCDHCGTAIESAYGDPDEKE